VLARRQFAQDVATDVDKAAKTTTHETAAVAEGSLQGVEKVARGPFVPRRTQSR